MGCSGGPGGPTASDYNTSSISELRRIAMKRGIQIDMLSRGLCAPLSELEKVSWPGGVNSFLPPEVQAWWEEHKEWDRKEGRRT